MYGRLEFKTTTETFLNTLNLDNLQSIIGAIESQNRRIEAYRLKKTGIVSLFLLQTVANKPSKCKTNDDSSL